MKPGGGGCSELKSHHYTLAWAMEQDSISKRKKERKKNVAPVSAILSVKVAKLCRKNKTISFPDYIPFLPHSTMLVEIFPKENGLNKTLRERKTLKLFKAQK